MVGWSELGGDAEDFSEAFGGVGPLFGVRGLGAGYLSVLVLCASSALRLVWVMHLALTP